MVEFKKEEIMQYIKHFDNIFNTDILNDFDMNKLTLFFSIYEKQMMIFMYTLINNL